ncbi:MAG TPA: SelB C-terminal domain-containing protein [Nannocystaceae bacterium]|nr:SelB C-terminal domain-containing protein [Nannocystaceae bacterium]
MQGRERVLAGNRVALNLAAVERSDVERGDVIARGVLVAAQSIVHARLHHLPGHSATWQNGTTLQVCAGTAHAIGVLDPLWLLPAPEAQEDPQGRAGDGIAVPPGRDVLVRIRLQTPLPSWRGQRIVVRSFDEPAGDHAGRTVGGGVIVDPEPSSGRGQRKRWIAVGRALADGDANARIDALLDDVAVAGIELDTLVRRTGVVDAAAVLARRTGKGGDVVELPGRRFVHEKWIRPLTEAAIAIVDRFHAQNPLQPGIGRAPLEAMLGGKVAPSVASQAIERAVQRGVLRVVDDQGMLARPGKGLQAGGELPGHMKTVLELYAKAGITPPTLKEVGDAASLSARDVLEIVTALQRMGKLVKITAELSLDRETHDALIDRIRAHLREAGSIDVQALKTMTGLTRKFAVPLLEHLDQLQITLRQGDTRIPGPRL